MKTLKLLLFVKLIVLKTCVSSPSDFDECLNQYRAKITKSTQELYLINSYFVDQKKQDDFIYICKLMGFKVRIIPDFCPEYGAKAVDELANIYNKHNFINLGVKNIYTYGDKDMADEKTYRNLLFVGNAAEHMISNPCIHYDYRKNKTCIKTRVCSYTDVDVDKNNELQCRTEYVDNIGSSSLKVVSKSISNYNQLYELAENFYINEPAFERKYFFLPNNIPEPIKNYSVLLCTGDEKRIKLFSNIPIIQIKNCDEIEYSRYFIAVIAPKPFQREDLSEVPVLFYDTLLLLPEVKDIYPNSLVLYESYFKSLNLALMRFIQSKGWRRIALVSDDTQHSEAFETEFTASLNEKGLLYMSNLCTTKICFVEALKSLRDASTKIIVANVDKKYAAALMSAAKDTRMTGGQDILWIWRDWPFGESESNEITDEMLSISLKPVKHIKKGVSMVNEAAVNMAEIDLDLEYKQDKGQFYRKFASLIQENQIREYSAEVRERSSTTNRHIATMKVTKDNVIVTSDTGYRFNDYPTQCSFKSNIYHEPCQDMYLIVIMLVVFIFMISFLALTIFFSRVGGSTRINYNNL